VIVLVVIAVLVVVAIAFGLAAVAQGQVVPAPSLSAPTPGATPSPTAPEKGAAGLQSSELDGQQVWLSIPDVDPVGLAVLFPGAEEQASALLRTATAEALGAAGWAVATGEFHGASWGSPASSADVAALRAWADDQVGALPALYVSFEMGGSTSLASMLRSPKVPVACWYGAGTVTDLATVGTAVPAVGSQIVSAWGGAPSADQAINAQIDQLPTATTYRVVIPGAGADDLRVQDPQTLISALEQSGHTVSQDTAASPLTTSAQIDADDVIAMAKGCLG
jgi:hypothetical protein